MSMRLAFIPLAFALSLPAAAGTVMRDDFSSAASGWPNAAATQDSDLGFAVYTDSGKYQMTPVKDEVFGFIATPKQAAGNDATLEADVFSPNALGAILTEQSIAALRVPVVAGGANNQLATPEDGQRLHQRGILYAPDYVINAGGIINVCTEYLADGDANLVRERIEGIPVRLEQIWAESEQTGRDPASVADAMAQRLIGRA